VSVSETVLDHGYIPEEHAPDPVISHGDPTAPGKIAIWLFLASEIMFFIAILGTYIILRSGSPALFAKHAAVLDKKLAALNTVVLITSSLTMALAVDGSQKGNRNRTVIFLALTVLCALGFAGVKVIEYTDKWQHQTLLAKDSSSGATGIYVYDGHVHEHEGELKIHGYRMPMPAPPKGVHGAPPPSATFDLHLISEADVKAGQAKASGVEPAKVEHGEYTVRKEDVTNAINYFPWRNTFFASYFTLTGVHMLHVFGGIIPLSILCIQALRGKLFPPHTEYTGLYWHFVDLVWIFLFPLLYLI
jgi:cytochrome c oxidase subunit 3